jgi:hypothetical protein
MAPFNSVKRFLRVLRLYGLIVGVYYLIDNSYWLIAHLNWTLVATIRKNDGPAFVMLVNAPGGTHASPCF